MLFYLIQTTLLLLFTLGLYKFILESTKIHVFKRYYLLFALLAVFLLPLIKIPSTGIVTATNTTISHLNEVIIGVPEESTTTILPNLTLPYSLLFLYLTGVTFMLIRFVLALLRFHRLQQQGTLVYDRGQRFVLVAELEMAFTFRDTIYLPLHIPIDWSNKIILHEYNHVKQRHSSDILFIEILKILFWFQPLLYWYQKNMALNHEFLADDTLNTSKEETQAYLQLLLTQTYLQQEQPLSSSFNFNLTKKRFMMLTKTNKPLQNTLAVLSTVFLFTIMGATTVFAQDKPKSENLSPKSTQTEDPNEVHIVVSEPANYPGGMSAFNQDFIQNFHTPKIEGESVRVILMFIVEKDGSLNEVKIVKDPGFGVGEAALAALAKTKKWIPAKHYGKIVRSHFTLPITVQLEAAKEA
ncbi:M56 family metallopeptidase [Myroides sp. DW712]|uniref:M56 family metallopeptidase n=1 Tax=Myroides sp. DW712 TaxID=3389800 RepID=UPI00397A8EA0